MQRDKLRSLVETSEDLPVMPQIWLRVCKITEDHRASAHDVAEVILKDQAMTARVLKAANSAHYAGYHQKITTITNAIVLLGFKEVRNIVLGYAAFNMLSRLKKNPHFDFRNFWIHSLATAVGAMMLAESIEYELPEEAFVGGLLHDVGKLLAAYLLPREYQNFIKSADDDVNLLSLERKVFGATHQEIGEWASKRWSFPEVLVHAIARHHRLGLKEKEKSPHLLIDIVAVADSMAKIIFRTTSEKRRPDVKAVNRQAQLLLGLSRERWALILRNLATKVRGLISEFNLKQEDLEAYTEFLEDSHLEHLRTERFYEQINRELTEKVKELNMLNQFSTALLQTTKREDILNLLMESIYRAINFSRVLLFVPGKHKRRLEARWGFGADVQHLINKAKLDINDKGAIVGSFTEGKIINILNAASNLYADQVSRKELELLQCASFACVPLVVNETTEGVVVVDNHISSEPVPDLRLNSVVTFVNQASLGLQRLPS